MLETHTMKFYKTIVLCLLLPLVAFAAKPLTTEELEIVHVNPVNLTVDEQISYFSNLYQVDVLLVSKVIDCESGGNHSVVSDGNRSKGIAQIQEPTWKWMEKQYFDEFGVHLSYMVATDQINMLAYQISKGNGRNWTAYRTIMNGGKYSFYSTQLQRHFTTYCRL